MKLVDSVNAGVNLLEFRPSEIAAAVALVSLSEIQVIDLDKSLTGCIYVQTVSYLT